MSLDGRIGSSASSQWIDGGGAGAAAAAPAPGSASAAALGNGVRQQSETLDEPVSTTILRDVRRVAVKLKHVLIPRDTVKELRDCQREAQQRQSESTAAQAQRCRADFGLCSSERVGESSPLTHSCLSVCVLVFAFVQGICGGR